MTFLANNADRGRGLFMEVKLECFAVGGCSGSCGRVHEENVSEQGKGGAD